MQLSIVIPIYRTAKNAVLHLPAMLALLRDKYKDFEIIFVIDNEHIAEEIKPLFELELQHDEIKIEQLRKNYGQHFATMCGYYLAKGDFIMSVDEDMTKYIAEICRTDAYIKSDVFYFYYDKNNMYKSDTRKVLSNLYKMMIHQIVNLKKHSTFRIISKPLCDRMLSNKHIFWNLDVMIFNNTNSVGSQNMEHCDVTDHNSGYNYKKLFQVAFEIAYEHNTIFMNLLIAIIPAFFYYYIYRDNMRTTVVYMFFAIIVTLFFKLFIYFTLPTNNKINMALKKKIKQNITTQEVVQSKD